MRFKEFALLESAGQYTDGLTVDEAWLNDRIAQVKKEQDDLDNMSFSRELDDDDKYFFNALEAMLHVLKNNKIALKKPELAANSIFLYEWWQEDRGFSSLGNKLAPILCWGAIQVFINNGTDAEIKWLGTTGGGTGRALMHKALAAAKQRGAKKAKVQAKWNSGGFYKKMGMKLDNKGEYDPLSDTSLDDYSKEL